MDSSEKAEETQENELIDHSIVKEEYELNEVSVPVVPVERISGDFPGDSKELVTFEIIEVDQKKKCKCPLCETIISTPSNLKRHMLKHSNIKNFECSHCSKAFREKRTLEKHLRTHFKQEPVKCDICNKTIKDSWKLKNHKRRQHMSPEKCHICGKVFSSEISLRDHIRRCKHKGDGAKELKPLICSICGKLFKLKHKLQSHVEAHSITFKCNICFRTFATRRKLTDHMRTHKPPPGKPFVCEICNKVFKTKTNLRCHQKMHLPEEKDPVKCIYCSTIFGKVYALQSHMRKDHRGLPKKIGADPTCTICKKDCKSIEDLKKHIEKSHVRKKRFECAICGFKAYHKSKMASHLMFVHLKMRNSTQCPICKKIYPSGNIKRHMKTHSEEKFPCDLCNKTFKNMVYLRKHKRLHESFTIECIYCKKICKNKMILGAHMSRCHRGLPVKSTGPPFKCSICFVTYTSLSSLVEHVTTHEASYKCASCNRKYIHKQNLEKHFEEVHLKKTRKPK